MPWCGVRRKKNTFGVGFLCGLYRPGEWLWTESNGKNGTGYHTKESFGNEFPSICNRCGVMAAWSRKTLKKMSNSCVFENNDPSRKTYSVPKGFIVSPNDMLCSNFVKFGWRVKVNVKSCVVYLTKKNKNSHRSQNLATARIAPKICQGRHQTMYCCRFHPNRFTFGEVISERVNTVWTCSRVHVFLFRWSLASSRI